MSTDLMDRFEYINFYFLTHSFILKIFGYIARTPDRRRRSRDRLVLFHPISPLLSPFLLEAAAYTAGGGRVVQAAISSDINKRERQKLCCTCVCV